MVGVSAAIRDVEDEINHAARCSAKVLITGESGVGKEIVARLIHERSTRNRGSLVTINCAGFPDGLLESELFGHVKGSFTDAHRDKRGWFEAAHGGTIFMDEIGEMSLRMQALLLRFLETGEIQRVGSERILQSVDVRVIAATHRRLVDHIADKTFREDLYYRLNVVHIEVPPLRDRREDVGALVERWEADRDHVQAVVQVLAERLVGNPIEQPAMRGGNDADVEGGGLPLRADALNFSGLEEPQHQRLHAQAHLTNFVHEDGAAMRGFEPSALVAVSIGEAAAEMPEEL